MSPEKIAQVCHAANRAYQMLHAAPDPSGPWEDTSQETRAAVVHGVKRVLAGDSPEQIHAEWVRYKRAHGWTWGPRKSSTRRTHPCMVPYADLMKHEQAKDVMFHGIVHALKDALEPLPDQ